MLLGLLLTAGLILRYAPVVASKIYLLCESTVSLESLGGLGFIQAGSRISKPESVEVVQVGQGEVLTLRGWVETSLGDGAPPSIVLESPNKKTPQVVFKVTAKSRPDLVKHFSNPILAQCGFEAQIRIPDPQPVGIYQIMIRRDSPGNLRHYYPKVKIEIITSAAGAALQKEEELKLHPPSPLPDSMTPDSL